MDERKVTFHLGAVRTENKSVLVMMNNLMTQTTERILTPVKGLLYELVGNGRATHANRKQNH